MPRGRKPAVAQVNDVVELPPEPVVAPEPVEDVAAPIEEPEPPPKLKRQRVEGAEKPKRPLNAFMLYSKHMRSTPEYRSSSGKGVTSIAKDLGERWRSMPEEEKSVWQKQASDLKNCVGA